MSVDSPAEPGLEFADAPPDGPRFRLQHLFVLTAVMAVMLALSGRPQSFPNQFDGAPSYQLLTTAWGIVGAILNSIAITLTGYGLYWRKRGGAFLVAPGHWLLLAMSIAAVVGAVQTGGYRLVGLFSDFSMPTTAPGPSPPPSTAMIVSFIVMAVLAIAFVAVHLTVNIIFGRKQAERRWRWVFYVKAIALFAWIFGAVLVLSWLIGTIWLDRREGVSRDAVHWCGVALELCVEFLTFVMSAGMMVFFVSQFR